MNRKFGSRSVSCLDVIFISHMTGEFELRMECSILNTDHAKVNSKSKSIKFASKILLRAFGREIYTLEKSNEWKIIGSLIFSRYFNRDNLLVFHYTEMAKINSFSKILNMIFEKVLVEIVV